MARATNFTDRQKAELFVRDRATCSYTGRSLWLLDFGADPYFQVDWADHRVPVARGGKSTLANAVCSSWAANFEKRDKAGHEVLVIRGEPTPTYKRRQGPLTPALRRQLERFSRLHYSDWFFNRSLFRLWLGLAFLSEDGCTRSRDDLYYARAALRMRNIWDRVVTAEKVPSLEARGLTPRRPREDQKTLLMMRAEASVDRIRAMMRLLLPRFVASL